MPALTKIAYFSIGIALADVFQGPRLLRRYSHGATDSGSAHSHVCPPWPDFPTRRAHGLSHTDDR